MLIWSVCNLGWSYLMVVGDYHSAQPHVTHFKNQSLDGKKNEIKNLKQISKPQVNLEHGLKCSGEWKQ